MQCISIEERNHFNREIVSISDHERDGLPPDSHVSVALKGNMKTAFTIDKARDLMIIQHFDLSC